MADGGWLNWNAHMSNAYSRLLISLIASLAVVSSAAVASARQDPPEDPPPQPAEPESPPPREKIPPLPDVDMRPTDTGLRFTPGMARAIAFQFTRQMKWRYELSDEQVKSIEEALGRQIMKLALDTDSPGYRDAIELMMETVIRNDGRLPAEEAKEFARRFKPALPHLDRFFEESAKQVSSRMNMSQRLKFTADSAPVLMGYKYFRGQIEQWERGQVAPMNRFGPDGRNRLDDAASESAVEDPAAAAPPEPEHVRVRRQSDNELGFALEAQLGEWREYVSQATAYYRFTDEQKKAAQGILKDSLDRAAAVRTPAWLEKLRENRYRRVATGRLGPDVTAAGPWMSQLMRERAELLKPIDDLFEELKLRIDALPTSEQREAARERIRQAYAKAGLEIK